MVPLWVKREKKGGRLLPYAYFGIRRKEIVGHLKMRGI